MAMRSKATKAMEVVMRRAMNKIVTVEALERAIAPAKQNSPVSRIVRRLRKYGAIVETVEKNGAVVGYMMSKAPDLDSEIPAPIARIKRVTTTKRIRINQPKALKPKNLSAAAVEEKTSEAA